MEMTPLRLCILLLTTAALVTRGDARRGPLRSMFPARVPEMVHNGVDPGEPLFLTPYLEKGEADQARQLSLVGPLEGAENVKSYSGFLTVNKTHNSNMFFWFFPATQGNPTTLPVLLWLQGGPGGTSMFGLFNEHGPFIVNADKKIIARKYAWTTKFNMLYIDNPVGTGFSFTKDDAGYAVNESDVGRDLYSALTQFFQIYEEYSENDFYITGESYAGKYVPAIAYTIHEMNKKPATKFRIKMRGIAIGDGLCDPETMLPGYGEFMYQIGIVDELQRNYINNQTAQGVSYIKQKRFRDAFGVFDRLLNGDTIPYPSYYTNVTGSTYYYNYMSDTTPVEFNYFYDYLAMSEVRKAIHVGNLTFNNGSAVEQHLLDDVMDTMKPELAVLMNNPYKVLIYSGQLDVIVAYPLTEAFLQSVEWKYAEEYRRGNRLIWKLNPGDKEVAGYVRLAGPYFNQVMIRKAGHILPYDQPEVALNMMDIFVNKPDFQNLRP